MLLDLHTHHEPPQPEGIVAVRFTGQPVDLIKFQAYSIGYHPWDTSQEVSEDVLSRLAELAARDEVVAVGEAGVDLSGNGGAMFRQLSLFKWHVDLSERLRKPLVIHDVKAHDIITGLHRDLKPKQNWAIHGFRGKPQLAEMMLKAGMYLSFGNLFNPLTLQIMPEDRILAETDDAAVDINEVIDKISAVRDKDMKETIAINTRRFLEKN